MDECEGNSLNVETRATRRQSRNRQGGVLGASPLEIKRQPPVFRRLSDMCTSQHGRDQRKVPSDWTMADDGQCRRPGLGVDVSLAGDGHINDTFSISLSCSWTNRTVTFNQIAKTAPVLNYVSLWTDSSNSSFYAWEEKSAMLLPLDQLLPVPENSVWKFTPADGGSGSWSEQAMPSNSIFSSLARPAGAIGGYSSGRTTPQTAEVDDFVPIPGIVSYDIEAGTLKNLSATDYSIYGTAIYGQVHSVNSSDSGDASPSSWADSSRSDTGAIAGGVVGGIAGLAMVGVLVWFLMRWRRRQSAEHEGTEWKAELQSHTPPDSKAEIRGPFSPEYSTSSKPLAELVQPQTMTTGIHRDLPRQELP
ncbi:hypothetical protein GJ744_011325 [Endocarpon pusillum]|uniref:Peptidase A1 domain-containing protein n=1 Tax=Endocarpon pusillum TaxID=364733 RepID=A0A8H7ARK7_9EURO|nr:hypothetical protein GJ744_011325 [Endocarpon pusillum]